MSYMQHIYTWYINLGLLFDLRNPICSFEPRATVATDHVTGRGGATWDAVTAIGYLIGKRPGAGTDQYRCYFISFAD